MPSPNLGEQVAQVIAALEKATPQVLALAERSFRQSALFNGALYAALLVVSLLVARWLNTIGTAKEVENDDESEYNYPIVTVFVIRLAFFGCLIVAVVMLCLLPDQVHQFLNARYYAVCDLLARVKPL